MQQPGGQPACHRGIHGGPTAVAHAVADEGDLAPGAVRKALAAVAAELAVAADMLGIAGADAECGAFRHGKAVIAACRSQNRQVKGPSAGAGGFLGDKGPVEQAFFLRGELGFHPQPSKGGDAAVDMKRVDLQGAQNLRDFLRGNRINTFK